MAPPTLLLTRPAASAEAFANALDPDALAQVRLVISPVMEIVGTGCTPVPDAVRGVIFTSANGVIHAPEGAGRVAYCVGKQTTRQAVARGWDARQAGDTAQELVAALCANPPQAPLLHLAGKHTRGEVAQTLTAAGIATTCSTLYDQKLLPLTSAAREALGGLCIVPVFSPRSALQLVREASGRLDHCAIIALSDSVALPFADKKIKQINVLPAPQSQLMIKAVENLCKTLRLP